MLPYTLAQTFRHATCIKIQLQQLYYDLQKEQVKNTEDCLSNWPFPTPLYLLLHTGWNQRKVYFVYFLRYCLLWAHRTGRDSPDYCIPFLTDSTSCTPLIKGFIDIFDALHCSLLSLFFPGEAFPETQWFSLAVEHSYAFMSVSLDTNKFPTHPPAFVFCIIVTSMAKTKRRKKC